MSETIVSKLSICKYDIDDIKILFEDGSIETIPRKNITFVNIVKNFFDMYLPIFTIKCNIDEPLYRKLNNSKPKYRITLKKFFIKTEDVHPNLKLPMRSVIIDDLFVNVNDNDKSVSLSEGIRKEITKSKDDTRPDIEKDNIDMDLVLFKQSHMEDYRSLNNNIYRNGNLTSVLLALFQLTKQDKCIMSPLDNNKFFKDEDVVIPNNYSLLGIVNYLQSVYGLYNSGYIIFRDFDRLYFLSKEINSKAFSKNEYKRVYIKFSDMTTTTGNTYGYIDDFKNKKLTIYNSNQPVINTSGSSLENQLYDEMLLIDTNSGEKQYKQIKFTKANNKKKIKVLDNKYGNHFMSNSIIYNIELENNVINMDIDECDITLLTPNKEYYIEFDDSVTNGRDLNGCYKLCSLSTIIQKKDDYSYISKSHAIFKKP